MRRKFLFPCICFFTFISIKHKKHLFLQEKSNDLDFNNDEILNELKLHTNKLDNYLLQVENKKDYKFHLLLKNMEEIESKTLSGFQPRLFKTIEMYKINKQIKNIHHEVKSIDRLLRKYLNYFQTHLSHCDGKYEDISDRINLNTVIDNIRMVNLLQRSSLFYREGHQIFLNYIFNDHEELVLRLLSLIVIINKHISDPMTNLNQDNIDFIKDYCKRFISHYNSENKQFYAKRVLINYYSKDKNYFYHDILLEINLQKNFKEFLTEISPESIRLNDDFKYDIVFLCGLNASFTISWRIPQNPSNKKVKDYLNFYLNGKDHGKIFEVMNFQLWIPKMLEERTLKDHKIRYLVSTAETKIFKFDHEKFNIPDLSVQEIADRIYLSLKQAKVGEKPVMFICHSMGGLLCKKILKRASEEQDQQFLNNIKGVAFFSTPHFGSNAIAAILELGLKKYSKLFRLFETTSSEYGLFEDDIMQKLSDINFSKATSDICFTPKQEFIDNHNLFRKLGIKYICLNEKDKTYIKHIGQHVYIVAPESSFLPETKNYILHGKVHGNLQKFSPDNMEEEGYKIMIDFINENLIKTAEANNKLI
jgi:hypothetical protein